MCTRPVAFDRAPYFAALVHSSCRAMLRESAMVAETRRGTPLISKRLASAQWGATVSVTRPRRSALSQFSCVRMSCARERHQARLEPCVRLALRLTPEALGGNRLHDGERVLHSVVQLMDQKLTARLGPSALGDVPGDLRRTNDPAISTLDG